MTTKREFTCNHVINAGTPVQRDCTAGARWQFWDGSKNYNDTILLACAAHIGVMLDPEIGMNVVNRIEY